MLLGVLFARSPCSGRQARAPRRSSGAARRWCSRRPFDHRQVHSLPDFASTIGLDPFGPLQRSGKPMPTPSGSPVSFGPSQRRGDGTYGRWPTPRSMTPTAHRARSSDTTCGSAASPNARAAVTDRPQGTPGYGPDHFTGWQRAADRGYEPTPLSRVFLRHDGTIGRVVAAVMLRLSRQEARTHGRPIGSLLPWRANDEADPWKHARRSSRSCPGSSAGGTTEMRPKPSPTSRAIAGVIVVSLALAASACGGATPTSPSSTQSSTVSQTAAASVTPSASPTSSATFAGSFADLPFSLDLPDGVGVRQPEGNGASLLAALAKTDPDGAKKLERITTPPDGHQPIRRLQRG